MENSILQIQCTITAEKIQSSRLEFEQITKKNATLFLEKTKKSYHPIGYFLVKVCMVLGLLFALYVFGENVYNYLNDIPECNSGITLVNCGIILLISLSFLVKDSLIGKAIFKKYISKVANNQAVRSFKSWENEFLPCEAVYTFDKLNLRYERQIGEAKKSIVAKSFLVDYFAVGEDMVLLYQYQSKKSIYPQQIIFVNTMTKILLIEYLENLGFKNLVDFLV